MPAKIDPEVTADVATEIWATVWRPKTLGSGAHPVVLFLHGNHGTCGRFDPATGVRVDDRIDYTFSGTCPSGYVVTPNHRGYDYLASELASYGYVVVTINANRGITGADGVPGDDGLDLRRGRLVLRHLQLLSGWNRNGGGPGSLGFDLKGRLDLSQVGLMGHSRGGEGMRAALAQYADAGSPWKARIGPAGFRALFEIGPVDGQTSRTLNALGTAWNVLLPYCDGDVSDLEGVKPFDRMLLAKREAALLPKSTFAVYGANHDFYNTEWQTSDSAGCKGAGNTALFPQLKGSAAQRQTALLSLVPFMRAHVGKSASPALAGLFDPDLPLPAALTAVTKVDRGYTDTPDTSVETHIEDFAGRTGSGASGLPETAQGIGLVHTQPPEQDKQQRAAAITWSGAGTHLFQTAGTTVALSGFKTLEFRASRQASPLNSAASTDFTVRLALADGSLSAGVPLSSYLDLRGPVGSNDALHSTLMTARIPLGAFGVAAGASVRGVRYTFDRTQTGAIYLADIRLSTRSAAAGTGSAVVAAPVAAPERPAPTAVLPGSAAIVAVRPTAAASPAGSVEVEVAADRPLPVTDALPTLVIGDKIFRLSRYADHGRTDRLVFTVDKGQLDAVADGAQAELRIGGARRLALGRLDKSMLR